MQNIGALTGSPLNAAHILVNEAAKPSALAVYRPDTARLALELAAAAYAMDIGPWLDAGWMDIAIQVDDNLYTGLNAGGGWSQRVGRDLHAARARAIKSRMNPVSQFVGLRRQKDTPDTCKALVMVRPLRTGRYLLCIAFMGTGKRLQDWSGNLMIKAGAEGFHNGFLALTKQFEDNAGRILLPRTAQRMGYDAGAVTLADALDDLKRPDALFSLFVTGHSQGAALMQIYIHRRLREGALAQNMLGYGFASPCVAAYDPARARTRYPIINIISADDVISRIGGQTHLGDCRVMPVTRAFRLRCQPSENGGTPLLTNNVLALARSIRDTTDALLMGMALMRAVNGLPDAQAEDALGFIAPDFLPERVAQALTGYAQKLARALERRLRAKYAALVQEGRIALSMDGERREAHYMDWLLALFAQFGVKPMLAALVTTLWRAHSLSGESERAYQLIVNDCFGQLRACAWRGGMHPAWDMRLAARRGRAPFAPTDRYHPLTAMRRAARRRSRQVRSIGGEAAKLGVRS